MGQSKLSAAMLTKYKPKTMKCLMAACDRVDQYII